MNNDFFTINYGHHFLVIVLYKHDISLALSSFYTKEPLNSRNSQYKILDSDAYIGAEKKQLFLEQYTYSIPINTCLFVFEK